MLSRRNSGAMSAPLAHTNGVNLKPPEHLRVAQRLEDGAFQRRRQVDLAARPVSKAEPDDMPGSVAGLDDVIIHGVHSNGAMRFSG
jgi:hypothetical protein